MEDFLYPYNQPKQFGKYDLFLDGKIVANEVVTKSGSVGGEGMTEEERQTLVGAAQKNSDNTFSANNTFTGTLDISNAQIVTPDGWNVEGLTAEQVQAVVPMNWEKNLVYGRNTPSQFTVGIEIGAEASSTNNGGISIGMRAQGGYNALAAGNYAKAKGNNSVALGIEAESEAYSVAVGSYTKSEVWHGVVLGYEAKTKAGLAVTVGLGFTETTDSGNVTHTCTTEGTGSITIGAGANTLNNGDVESSNSVTIGCKAENKGADSVVIGAQASCTAGGALAMGVYAKAEGVDCTAVGVGAEAKNAQTVAVGKTSKVSGSSATAVGARSSAAGMHALALGLGASASSSRSVAIGSQCKSANTGAVVFRSTADDDTYTQLYFSGANTPLANTYENGAPMLGYVTKDAQGNVVAAGTRSLLELLTNNSTFAPAQIDENGEWVAPKVFHPSDLDMPIEEDTVEPEEYQPLPVYPIVEPTIEEIID